MTMQASVANPELIYRSEGISETSAARLRALGYGEERIRLLRQGLPITYALGEARVLEYPSGRRVEVQRHKELSPEGVFVRYRYEIVRELPAQERECPSSFETSADFRLAALAQDRTVALGESLPRDVREVMSDLSSSGWSLQPSEQDLSAMASRLATPSLARLRLSVEP